MATVLTKEEKRLEYLYSESLAGILQTMMNLSNPSVQAAPTFWLFGLGEDHRLLFMERVAEGALGSTKINFVEVFNLAFQKETATLVLCCYKPNGVLEPTALDEILIERLFQIGQLVSVPVVDYLLVAKATYFTFKYSGWLAEIEERFDGAASCTQEAIKAQIAAIYARRGGHIKQKIEVCPHAERLNIARQLKALHLDIRTIATTTQLTKQEIEAL